jgi:hypothetical protein
MIYKIKYVALDINEKKDLYGYNTLPLGKIEMYISERHVDTYGRVGAQNT